uniref:Uncharacterized protein n=1 Tax=Octopus bimaculoides TaxID=37653 RepID=A0A0L8GEW9_OCTBM
MTASDGRQYRRNHRHLRTSVEKPTAQPNGECKETVNCDTEECETLSVIKLRDPDEKSIAISRLKSRTVQFEKCSMIKEIHELR